MRKRPIFATGARRDPVPRLLSAGALGVSILALIFSMTGVGAAHREVAAGGAKPGGAGKAKEESAGAERTKARRAKEEKARKETAKKTKSAAKKKQREAGEKNAKLNIRLNALKLSCPISGAIDMGSYCLEGTTYKVPTADVGKNNYMYATQKCVAEGGWLPSAAQLVGAAPLISLKSTIDDDPATSAVSEFPEAASGIKDEREMTSDLFTTGAGSRAAGSEGVTVGSQGTGNLSEPNPIPMPAEPMPETLDYITVYDNHNLGGFAGGEPITKAENFRCAYAKKQGKARNISSRS